MVTTDLTLNLEELNRQHDQYIVARNSYDALLDQVRNNQIPRN